MTDTLLFEYEVKRSGKTMKSICEALGIGTTSLWSKVHNVTEFKASEIDGIKNFCGWSNDTRDKIFFSQEVEK